MKVLVYGNPADGLSLIGPFEHADEAAEYGGRVGVDWWVMEMLTPAEYEASLHADPDDDEPEVCPSCGAVEGTDAWGTAGDGFDGYCPSCADKREPKD